MPRIIKVSCSTGAIGAVIFLKGIKPLELPLHRFIMKHRIKLYRFRRAAQENTQQGFIARKCKLDARPLALRSIPQYSPSGRKNKRKVKKELIDNQVE